MQVLKAVAMGVVACAALFWSSVPNPAICSWQPSAGGIFLLTFLHLPIRAPLDRFRVGLMAAIPTHSWKLQKHKNLKNFSNLLGTKRKVVGKGRFSLLDFLPEVKK